MVAMFTLAIQAKNKLVLVVTGHLALVQEKAKGIAKDCEDKGGERVSLGDYMKGLWEKLGFKPAEFSAENLIDTDMEDVEVRENRGFTPTHRNKTITREKDKENFSGISLRNLPLDIGGDQVQTFLESYELSPAQTQT